ncbi:MAG: STAS domain-containing protein [Verrucomicrobiaceae bacterium]|nr:STAS domain-containing protein [Verrucomicrobiaceae bacterium]
MHAVSSILVGKIGSVLWMRVTGKGTFQNSIEVKRCFQSVIAAGTKDFVVDLECCPTMDSTFLGTLTGAALNLRDAGGGGLSILNANERNQHLLTSLGLDHILALDLDGTSWAEERKEASRQLAQCDGQTAPVCKEEQARQVLQAHEALTAANAANLCKFKDVIQFLKEELDVPGGDAKK